MKEQNYLNININNLLSNLNTINNTYHYTYYILDVSNNAYNHGMYLINYLNYENIYLYVNNFNDLLLLRKYNSTIPTIYSGNITSNNIYDLIVNNAILLIKDLNILKTLKEKTTFILNIDEYNGIYSLNTILELLDLLKTNHNLNLLGIISNVNKDNFENIKYLIKPLKDLPLICFNNEKDKQKIKYSNTIFLNNSLYGLNTYSKKNPLVLKQVLTLKAKLLKITKEYKKKKEIYIGLISLGYLNGFLKNINEVLINNKSYKVLKIEAEYTLIIIDNTLTLDDDVIITSELNPLNLYYKDNILLELFILKNLPIQYENEEQEIYSYL